MTDEKPYFLSRQYRAEIPDGFTLRCQGRGCGRIIVPGEVLSVVSHRNRSRDTPNADDSHATLCETCLGKMGEKVAPKELTGAATPIPYVPDPRYPPF